MNLTKLPNGIFIDATKVIAVIPQSSSSGDPANPATIHSVMICMARGQTINLGPCVSFETAAGMAEQYAEILHHAQSDATP